MARITAAEYSETIEKIAKINARAEKKGFTGRIEITAERVEVTRKAAGIEVTEVAYDVTLGGEAPSYNGWTLAAVLDFDPEAGLIVNTAPGVESVNREGLTAGTCAHCNTSRDRRKAYLVRNVETGEQVQVGSTCIKDFLGWSGQIVFLYADDIAKEVEDGWGSFGGSYGEHRYTVDTVLAVAWAAIKVAGWKPASSYEFTTRGQVALVLNPPSRLAPRDKEFIAEVEALAATEDITARAAEVKAFILSTDFAGESEYVLNLKALMAADSIGERHFGIVVSAPQAHAKHTERTLLASKAAEIPASEWFGVEKEKVTFTGTITNVRFIESQWGSTVLYVIRNLETGVEVKWFASREALGDKQGVEVTITGTVKGHDEFRGMKSTVLTRCKAV